MTEPRLNAKEQPTSIWALGRLTVLELTRRVWKEIDRDDILGRASELAYNFLLSAFPLLLFLLSLLGIFASEGSALRHQLFSGLAHFVPPSASNLIFKTMHEITSSSGRGKLTFGLLFFLWSAARGVTTMIAVLNAAYHVRDSRPWYKVRVIATMLTLMLTVIVVVALTIVLFGGQLTNLVASRVGFSSVVVLLWRVIEWLLALFFMSFAFSLLYYFGPDVNEQPWYWITPGSLVGVLLWVAASFGMRIYLHYFNSYSKTYGSLGGVMILLLWFYVTGLAFLIGAVINAVIEHAAAERRHPETKLEREKAA